MYAYHGAEETRPRRRDVPPSDLLTFVPWNETGRMMRPPIHGAMGSPSMQGGGEEKLEAVGPVGGFLGSARPIQLAVGTLRQEITRWSKRDLPWVPDAWVLQAMLNGLVWRYERWADMGKEILAVALIGE